MNIQNKSPVSSQGAAAPDFEAIVIGAGFGGIRALYELRKMGLSVQVFEAASNVGGAWYWNRYPGARTDTEAWAYCFSFSKELQQEWDWSERMPSWDQVIAYQSFVVDKLDLRQHIQFNTRIKSALYNEATNQWTITTEAGKAYTCTYFVSAAGLLTVAYEPPFKGLNSFNGQWYVTSRWPKEPVDFAGKRVGIVGSGSTAVQVLPVVAQTAAHVSIFQRTPNYVMPGRNHRLDDAQRQGIKANLDAMWKMVRRQSFAFPMDRANRLFDDCSPEEQERHFDAAWEAGGFRFVFEAFDDLTVNERANAAAAAYVRKKIRAIVKDPKTAELLCPTYEFAVKRPPVGNFYYESFNRDNVRLVDVSQDAIQEITPKGIRTGSEEHEFDILIFALGFDAVTGALTNMDVRGKGGMSVKEKWEAGPRTKLGITMDGFPNMFMLSGPQTPFANIPPVLEAAVTWIGKAIQRVRDSGCRGIEPTPEAVSAWTQHMQDLLDVTLLGRGAKVGTWYMGANIPGKTRSVLFYFGGAEAYFNELDKSIDSGFEGFKLIEA
jgi:cation diffusion facilitator CzcD-associated flavoprotein CzcO